jgi:hypothetical protein
MGNSKVASWLRRLVPGLAIGIVGGVLLVLGAATAVSAQSPAPMQESGCCCVATKDGTIGCGQKTQVDCLGEQPSPPLFDQLPDWSKAVAESEAQEHAKIKTGWRAGACSQ